MSEHGTQGGSSSNRLTSSSPVQESSSVATESNPPTDHHRCDCIAKRLGNVTRSCDDDPPPYASLVGPSSSDHRTTWSYMFPDSSYEDRGGGTSGEPRSIARPLVSIPLTSYGIFKIEPPRYAAAMLQPRPYPRIVPEPGPAVKSSTGTARKYGAILIAATVITFLMALSLMVRFVTEKSLWRG